MQILLFGGCKEQRCSAVLPEPELCQSLKGRPARPNYTAGGQEVTHFEKGQQDDRAGQFHPPQTQNSVVASVPPMPGLSELSVVGKGSISKF